jgi:hypothetical protein
MWDRMKTSTTKFSSPAGLVIPNGFGGLFYLFPGKYKRWILECKGHCNQCRKSAALLEKNDAVGNSLLCRS